MGSVLKVMLKYWNLLFKSTFIYMYGVGTGVFGHLVLKKIKNP